MFVVKPLAGARGAFDTLSGRVFYGWWIVAAGMISSVVMIGISIHSLTAFFNPIADEMGWSRTKLSLAFSIRGVEAGLVSASTGFIIEKVGARRVAIVGAILMALGFLIVSQTRDLWVFYGGFMVLSLSQSLSSIAPYTATIVHWFKRKRGRALSVYLSSTAAGAFLVLPATLLIGAYGWRPALVVFAGLSVLIGIPAALMIRSRPEDHGMLPDGDTRATHAAGPRAPQDPVEQSESLTARGALRTRTFWMLSTLFGIFNLGLVSYTIFVIPHMQAEGYSTEIAAILATVWGLGNLIARLGLAAIADKVNKAALYSIGVAALGGSLLAFAFVAQAVLLPIYLVALCIGQSIGVIMNAAIVAEYYGPKHYASIQGLTSGLMVGFAVVGPLLGGMLFDSTGSYRWMFIIYGALMLLAAPLAVLAPRPMRQRARIPAPATA